MALPTGADLLALGYAVNGEPLASVASLSTIDTLPLGYAVNGEPLYALTQSSAPIECFVSFGMSSDIANTITQTQLGAITIGAEGGISMGGTDTNTGATSISGVLAYSNQANPAETITLQTQIAQMVSEQVGRDVSLLFSNIVDFVAAVQQAHVGSVGFVVLSDIQLSTLQTISENITLANIADTSQGVTQSHGVSLSVGGMVGTEQQAGVLLSLVLGGVVGMLQQAGQNGAVTLIVQSTITQDSAFPATELATQFGASITVIAGADQTHKLSFTLNVTADFLANAFPPIPDKDLLVYVAGDTSLAIMFAAAEILAVAAQPSEALSATPARTDKLTAVIAKDETIN